MESIWCETCSREKAPALEGNVETDVAVIGGGMAGILTAWQLEQAGVRTVVLEADRIGGGQTQNTTAKITAQHGMFCHSFIEKKGEDTARKYAQANKDAIEEYKRIVREKSIACDLKECDSYVYSEDEEKVRKEVEAAQSLGLEASFAEQVEIPVVCAGAVRFSNQAKFHPLKFIEALAEYLTIYEDTSVTGVEGHLVKTPCGSVRAGKIVFAAHFPFINFPGMYFARMHQERSYVLALEKAGTVEGMYIGDGENKLSFRQYDRYLLLGGQAHRTGENREGGCYERLKKVARELYPGSCVAAYWSAQDCITADKVPFIGPYAADRPELVRGDGISKMGYEFCDGICNADSRCGLWNRESVCTGIFSSEIFRRGSPQLMKDGGKAAKGLTKRFFHVPSESISSVERGHGAIVETPQGKAGVYKTEEGTICQVSAVCPHMGCELTWNPDENSWDCPCHGSRFDRAGKLLDGPAQEGIQYDLL